MREDGEGGKERGRRTKDKRRTRTRSSDLVVVGKGMPTSRRENGIPVIVVPPAHTSTGGGVGCWLVVDGLRITSMA
jgi:hypothetical protein